MRKIPTIEELKNELVELSELQKLLESDPLPEWLKVHPNAIRSDGSQVLYLPIEKVDYLLRSIFNGHWWEILNTSIHQNSIQVTGRLLYVNPENGKVMHQDGVGGAMTAQGIEVAIAIAESNAKKNAAKKIGKIFGRDLSRDFNEPKKEEQKGIEIPKKTNKNPVLDGIIKQIEKSKTKKQFQTIHNNVNVKVDENQLDGDEIEQITTAIQQRMSELNLKF